MCDILPELISPELSKCVVIIHPNGDTTVRSNDPDTILILKKFYDLAKSKGHEVLLNLRLTK